MRKIWVISDTHFSHVNILKFLDKDGKKFRGDLFASIEQMNETMVRNWNATIHPEDIVYHLGDVYFGSQEAADTLLSRLMGRKRLILGNYDKGKDTVLAKHFEKILVSRIFKEYDALLTHFPVHPSNLAPGKYGRNIHGHIHQNDSPDPRYINVSVEKIYYTPVDLAKL